VDGLVGVHEVDVVATVEGPRQRRGRVTCEPHARIEEADPTLGGREHRCGLSEVGHDNEPRIG